MTTQDLEIQIRALEKLKSCLQQVSDRLQEVASKYNSSIDVLVENGLPIQVAETYKNTYLSRNVSAINSLIRGIQEEDMAYVNKNIEALQGVLEQIRRASV